MEKRDTLIALKARVQFFPGQAASKAISKLLWGDSASAAKGLSDEMIEPHQLLQKGDLSGIGSTLLDQIHVLNRVFHQYASLGARADRFSSFQKYFKTALKAQNLCRRTVATLTDLKSPKQSAMMLSLGKSASDAVRNFYSDLICFPLLIFLVIYI